MNVGDRTPSKRRLPPGFRMDRVVSGFAYARNGNSHNPTPRYRWDVFHGDTLVGTQYTEQAGVELARDHAQTLVAVLGAKP